MKVTLLFFLIIFSGATAAQDKIIAINVGLGTYSMNTQKSFQQEFLRQSDLPLKAVHKFPPYGLFGASFGLKMSKTFSSGVWIEYTSTGGTLHYGDYSGEARMDQLLKSLSVGTFLQLKVNRSEGWPLFATLHGSVVPTNADISTELVIGNDSAIETIELKAINFGIRPGFMLQRKIKKIVVMANVGYEFQIAGKLKTSEGAWLEAGGETVKAEWGGLRAGIGLGLSLTSKASRNK
ncbi:MAG TPA: hypothetical protein VK589_22400 [Chryseolinea sp.]|nr:hypothetical protein [Chryseolinea sp.]